MLSVSQIAPYLSDESPRRRFKPWWEDVADYLTHALLITALFSWTFLLQDHSSGINCILQDGHRSIVFNTIYARYLSQKCALEIFNGCFTYYPYYVFFQWMLLLFCQIFWLKLPQVNSKLEVMHQILDKLKQANKIKDEKQKGRKRENSKIGLASQCNVESYARLRLQFFLEEQKMTISKIYICKSFITFGMAIVFFGLIFHQFPGWTGLWRTQNISYNTSLSKERKEAMRLHMFCNLGCGRITFVLICLNLTILLSFIITSVIGYALWTYKKQNVERSVEANLPRNEQFHSGLAELYVVIAFINARKQYGNQVMEKLKHLLLALGNGNSLGDTVFDETHI